MRENRHVGRLFLDFFRDKIGLHVNGNATMLSPLEFSQRSDDDAVAKGGDFFKAAADRRAAAA